MRKAHVAVLVLLGAALLNAQQPQKAPENFKHLDGVPFAQGANGPLLANLLLPQSKEPTPAIVYIHGGAWTGGDRRQMDIIPNYLAPHGYAGMSIDYDLSPSVRFPVALMECKEAIRWLRAHAAQYHIDPERIAVAGASSGGELAALVALTGDDPRYEGRGENKNFSSAVQAGLTFSTPMDFTTFSYEDSSILTYIGGSCLTRKALCIQASPRLQIGSQLPPMYVGHGNADHDVPYSQAVAFVDSYRAAHGLVTFYTAEGGSHEFGGEPPWSQQNLDNVYRFLEEFLNKRPALGENNK